LPATETSVDQHVKEYGFVPLGDDALLVTFSRSISWEVGVKVRAAARRIRDLKLPSVSDIVPAYTTLAVYFDSSTIAFESMVELLAPIVRAEDVLPEANASLIEVPVYYDGPDLAEVAERTGLSVEEVIRRHSDRSYRAYATGFQPGFAYLGELDPALVLPRRAEPRLRVRAGSVAIAGAQTAVYPLETPGGWHLIGETPLRMFDADRNPPSVIQVGDMVRFVRARR
jgi:KipI family sensor histidine kinase inhibitor